MSNNIPYLFNNDDNTVDTSFLHLIGHEGILYLILPQLILDILHNPLLYNNPPTADDIDNIESMSDNNNIKMIALDAPLHIIDHESILYLVFLQILLFDQQYAYDGSNNKLNASVSANDNETISTVTVNNSLSFAAVTIDNNIMCFTFY